MSTHDYDDNEGCDNDVEMSEAEEQEARRAATERREGPAEPCEFCGAEYPGQTQGDKDEYMRKTAYATDSSYLYLHSVMRPFHEVGVRAARAKKPDLRMSNHACAAVRLAYWTNPRARPLGIATDTMLNEPEFEVRRAMWDNENLALDARRVLAEEFGDRPAAATPVATGGEQTW